VDKCHPDKDSGGLKQDADGGVKFLSMYNGLLRGWDLLIILLRITYRSRAGAGINLSAFVPNLADKVVAELVIHQLLLKLPPASFTHIDAHYRSVHRLPYFGHSH